MSPTLTAAHSCCIGDLESLPSCTRRVTASWSARKPPQTDAVRVPPSACNTSQSTITWRWPSAARSIAVLSERPMRRCISLVRPPTRRATRSGDEPGSIEYSAVTQPRPRSRSQRGTFSSTDAVQSTLVPPNSASTEPFAMRVKSRRNRRGLNSSNLRPSARRPSKSITIMDEPVTLRRRARDGPRPRRLRTRRSPRPAGRRDRSPAPDG